jgi:hypothetical protein
MPLLSFLLLHLIIKDTWYIRVVCRRGTPLYWFADFSKQGFSRIFSINLAGRQLYRWPGEGARGAPFCVLMSLKRQVRIANGRVTRPEPTSYLYGTCMNLYLYEMM